MHLPDASYWHLGMNSLDFLRMPMFSVLSGFLYAAHRVTPNGLASFFQKKAMRLLLPLLFVTSVMVILRQAVYGDDTSYVTALLYHYQHLWFLQALILIFIGIALWDAFARPSWVGLCVAAFAAIMVSRTFTVTTFLSLDGALYLLPFFALGMILRTETSILRSANLTKLAIAVVAIVMLMQQASALFGGSAITRLSVPAALCGVSGAYLMLVLCPKIRLLEAIGGFSYTIYLWHSIAASGVRNAVEPSVRLPTAIEFAVLLIAGVAIPIALHLVVQRIPLLSVLAAGIRPQQSGKIRTEHANAAPW